MKFAKKLVEEMQDCWNDKYIDYKMMKKVLKQNDADAIQLFCDLYEDQVRKIHEFMSGKQEEITAGIRPLELNLNQNLTLKELRSATQTHCQQLVQDIECFRDYASLNMAGMRKIVKKFDKRHQLNFNELFAKPKKNSLLVSDHDIGKLLLFPASQCLKLMRLAVDPASTSIERPLRQYNFWVEELRAGAEIARCQFHNKHLLDTTRVRLAMHCGQSAEDLSYCIKNTFIKFVSNSGEVALSPTSRRCSSEPRLKVILEKALPGVVSEADILRQMPVVNVEHFICESLNIAPPPRELDADFTHAHRSPSQSPSPRSPSPVYARWKSQPQLPRTPRSSSTDDDSPVQENQSPEFTVYMPFFFPAQPVQTTCGTGRARQRSQSRPPAQNFGASSVRKNGPPGCMEEIGGCSSNTYRWWTGKCVHDLPHLGISNQLASISTIQVPHAQRDREGASSLG